MKPKQTIHAGLTVWWYLDYLLSTLKIQNILTTLGAWHENGLRLADLVKTSLHKIDINKISEKWCKNPFSDCLDHTRIFI